MHLLSLAMIWPRLLSSELVLSCPGQVMASFVVSEENLQLWNMSGVQPQARNDKYLMTYLPPLLHLPTLHEIVNFLPLMDFLLTFSIL